MAEIGHAALPIIPSMRGVEGKLNSGLAPIMDRQGGVAGSTFGDKFGSAFKTAAKASLVGVGALAVGAFQVGKAAVKEASDLGESLNAVNVSYGKNAKAVKDLGAQAADTLGLSNSQFNSLAVRFSAFSRQIAGSEGKKVVTTLDDLTTRAADFASVMNLEVADAAALFQSGLAGETEPLRQFGIDLSAAKVEAFAYANGIAKTGEELTEGEKVQARYGALMEQTAKTQGDFANTSDSLANRQRILNARWDDAQAKLGNALLPILEDFTGFLIEKGLPAVEDFSDWFNEDGIPALKDFGGFVKDDVLPVLEDIGDFAKTAGGHVKDMVGFFGDLPNEAKIAGLAALVGGIGAMKLRGGKGALGTAGSALGLTKPIPVFVTNPGFGVGGVPGGPGAGPAGGPGRTARTLGKVARGVPIIGSAFIGNEALGAATGLNPFSPSGFTLDPNSADKTIAAAKALTTVVAFFNGKTLDEFVEDTRDAGSEIDQVRGKTLGWRESLIEGKNAGEKLVDEVFKLNDGLGKARGRHEVNLVAPGFESLLAKTTTYSDILNNMDGRVVRIHFQTIQDKNVILPGQTGPRRGSPGGDGGGRTGGVDVHIHGDVRPNDSREFMEYIANRARRAAVDGRRP